MSEIRLSGLSSKCLSQPQLPLPFFSESYILSVDWGSTQLHQAESASCKCSLNGNKSPPPPYHLESSRDSVVFTADIFALRCLEVFLVSPLIVFRPWYSVPSFSWGKTLKSSRLTLLCSLILSQGKRVMQSLTTHGKRIGDLAQWYYWVGSSTGGQGWAGGGGTCL